MQDGATSLGIASQNGHAQVCSVLIAAGACVDAPEKVSGLW